MGTRSVIARKTATGFNGVYHHWDGYPSGVGATLFRIHKDHFKNDTKAMLRFLIDEHPEGWSSINGADWGKIPTFDGPGPQCYDRECDKKSGDMLLDQATASDSGCEYAYVLQGNEMLIYSSYCGPDTPECEGQKMIGMCSFGDSSATWKMIATIDLNGEEPDWKKIEEDN